MNYNWWYQNQLVIKTNKIEKLRQWVVISFIAGLLIGIVIGWLLL